MATYTNVAVGLGEKQDSGSSVSFTYSASDINNAINSAGIPSNCKVSRVVVQFRGAKSLTLFGSSASITMSVGSYSKTHSGVIANNGTNNDFSSDDKTCTSDDIKGYLNSNGRFNNDLKFNLSPGGSSTWWRITATIYIDYDTPYTINVVANNSNYGYTTGSGTYYGGTALTMSAHPYAGYKFVQWSDGVTSAVRVVSVTGNATYTAQFRPIYISYDSVFSYKMWADTNLVTWDLMQIVNKTDTGFTGKALVEDSYTIESRPLIDLTGVNRWTFKCDTSSSDFEIFLFNCDASGAWADFNYTRSNEISINNVKGYLSIRCDIVGTGKEVTFSNFRLYPEQYPYMSNSVTAAERTGRGGQAMPTPTRVGYTFTGWNTKPDGTGTTYTVSNLPTDDIVLYSQWTVKTFKVTFKDDNGYTLKTETVNYGSTVTAPTDPVKADTAQHKYTFDGWYDANGNKWYPNTAITGETVYTARFNSTVQRYTVKWYNEDGSVLLETDESVPYGTMPTYNGATPTKAETAAETYEHIGWSIDVNSSGTTELTAVIEAVSYYARFRAISKGYTVIWKNEDGTVLETDTLVPFGTQPDYNGATPEKASDVQYNYTFLGWSAKVEDPPLDESQLPTVTGNITYTAVYTKTLKLYPVKVILFDTEYTSVVEYGSDIVLEAPEVIGYKFTQWNDGNTDNPRIVEVTGEATYQAVYERIPVPIIVNEEQRVTGVYIVPDSQTIVYVISGEVPAVVANGVTVDDLSFEVSNSVPDNSYPIEKLYINETRVY